MNKTPILTGTDEWRRRWLVSDHGDCLHRIAEIGWDREGGETYGQGEAVCGLSATFSIPGIFTRMGGPRCKRCCDALGIPQGDGAPGNCDFNEPGCEEPEAE